ncbi:MAG: CHAP domain-containing protein [Patescibacteria group bacterium]|nr:CHAP domain-containing protein [Patescibacteria group bacterium]
MNNSILRFFCFFIFFIIIFFPHVVFAQSASFTTKVGNPLELQPRSTDYAEGLVRNIQSACGKNNITENDIDCFDKLSSIYNTDVLNELKKFNNNTPPDNVLQCVNFVRAFILGSGWPSLGTGNALGYFKDMPGYRKISVGDGEQIQPGDIPIWNRGKYGHIAIVTSVADNQNFSVAEANWDCTGSDGEYHPCGKVGIRNTTIDGENLLGWLRKK